MGTAEDVKGNLVVQTWLRLGKRVSSRAYDSVGMRVWDRVGDRVVMGVMNPVYMGIKKWIDAKK